MEKDEKDLYKAKPNDHLANERTMLAWIRTAIAIMGFGFLVVKFSMFLQQFGLLVGKEIVVKNAYTDSLGVLIVAIGIICLLVSFVQYKITERRLLNDRYKPSSTAMISLVIALMLLGGVLIWYLLQSMNAF